MKFPSAKKALKPAIDAIMADLKSSGFDSEDLSRVRLGIGEALINAMEHGNRFRTDLLVDAEVRIEPDRVVIRIKDQGPGFDISKLPKSFERENLWLDRGRGVLLIKALFDEVEFNKKGNEITMIKHLPRLKPQNCGNE